MWDKDGGDDLLDLTDPANPVIVTSGTYAICLCMKASGPLTAAGSYEAGLYLDTGGANLGTVQDSAPSTANQSNPGVALSATLYMTAGTVITMYVTNNDGVASRDFSLQSAVVQRLA